MRFTPRAYSPGAHQGQGILAGRGVSSYRTRSSWGARRLAYWAVVCILFLILLWLWFRTRGNDAAPLRKNSNRSLEDGVSVLTHLTCDRMGVFAAMMDRWPGPASAAFFLKNVTTEYGKLQQDLSVMNSKRGKKSEIGFSMLYLPSYIYPVNILRNLASQSTRQRLSVMLDADFVPSAGLHDFIMRNYAFLSQRARERTVFVLPCFEQKALDATNAENVEQLFDSVPRTKSELLQNYEKKLTIPMFEDDPIHHAHHMGCFDFQHWFQTNEFFEVPYRYPCEPYVLGDTELMPAFDERFVYYGNDKAEFTYHLHKLGFRFEAIPDHFIVHIPHEAAEWKQYQRAKWKYTQTMFRDLEKEYGR